MWPPLKVIIMSSVSFSCVNRDQNGGEFNNVNMAITNNLPWMSWTSGQLVRFLIKPKWRKRRRKFLVLKIFTTPWLQPKTNIIKRQANINMVSIIYKQHLRETNFGSNNFRWYVIVKITFLRVYTVRLPRW